MRSHQRNRKHFALACFLTAAICTTLPAQVAMASTDISLRAEQDVDSCGGQKVFRLTGPIEKGAAAHLRQALSQSGIERPEADFRGSPATLELDSPGGSLPEGIELAKVIREYAVRTLVPDGARCESACAVAFMAGKTIALDGKPIPLRELHPRGRLGFHAPSLPDEIFRGISPSDKQKLRGLETVMVEAAREYYLLMRTDNWAQSLVEASLSTLKPGEMIYVDTVDKAGRWRIDIDHEARLRLPGLNTPGRAAFCINTWKWSEDRSAKDFIASYSTDDFRRYKPRSFVRGNHYQNVLRAHSGEMSFVGGMDGDDCYVELDRQGRILDANYFSRYIAIEQVQETSPAYLMPIDRIRAWHALPPETRLPDIDTALKRVRIFSVVEPALDTAPLTVSIRERLWDHNGVRMKSELHSRSDASFLFRILYWPPYIQSSPALQELNIKQGTLFFEGAGDGDRVRGIAYRFKRGCQPLPFSVEGTFNGAQETFSLRGAAPILSARGCNVVSHDASDPAASLTFTAANAAYGNETRKRVVACAPPNRPTSPDPTSAALIQQTALAPHTGGWVNLASHAFDGRDIATLPKVSRERCEQACADDARCVGFLYDKWNRWCFLKDGIATAYLHPKYDIAAKRSTLPSGLFPRSPAPRDITLYRGKHFPGATGSRTTATSLDGCGQTCLINQDCVAFSYSRRGPKSQRCLLMSEAGEYFTDRSGRTDSGIITQAGAR